jgi:hypothetical protein
MLLPFLLKNLITFFKRVTVVDQLLLTEFRWASPVGETDVLSLITLECTPESPHTLTGLIEPRPTTQGKILVAQKIFK